MLRNIKNVLQAGCSMGLLAGLVATPALAHHPMGGMTPQTLWQGFASGIGHPVIGPDHFIFFVLAALLFSMTRVPLQLALTLVVSGIAGTFLRVLPIELPFLETLVALSLIVAGAIILLRVWSHSEYVSSSLAGLVALAGTLHGFAWGESVVGADAAVIGSYLAGLTVVQIAVVTALTTAFGALCASVPRARTAVLTSAGVAGIVAGVGFVLVA